MAATREEVRIEEAQQASEEFALNRKVSRHNLFWTCEVCEMGSSGVSYVGWTYSVGGESLEEGCHPNDRGRSPGLVVEKMNLVQKAVCEPDDCACSSHSSCKIAKKGAQRSHIAVSQDPQEEEWSPHWASKAYEMLKICEGRNHQE